MLQAGRLGAVQNIPKDIRKLTKTMIGLSIPFVLGLCFLPVVLAADSNSQACDYINGFAAACANAYPGFSQAPFQTQASCPCYAATVWVPDNYDRAFTSCGSFVKTASPDLYSSITAVGGPWPTAPCRSVGNIRHYSEPDANQMACSAIQQQVAYCAALTPGFVTMPFSKQASCACYRSQTAWIGQTYDVSVASCLKYISTASSSYYSAIVSSNGGPLETAPCQSVQKNQGGASPSSPLPPAQPAESSKSPIAASTAPPVVVPTTSANGSPQVTETPVIPSQQEPSSSAGGEQQSAPDAGADSSASVVTSGKSTPPQPVPSSPVAISSSPDTYTSSPVGNGGSSASTITSNPSGSQSLLFPGVISTSVLSTRSSSTFSAVSTSVSAATGVTSKVGVMLISNNISSFY